jgi:hypothetical protein
MLILKPEEADKWYYEKCTDDLDWYPHRCRVIENIKLNDGYIIQEGPEGILIGFGTENDRINSCRNIVSRGINVLPLEGLRVWIVIPYISRPCCDRTAIYKE